MSKKIVEQKKELACDYCDKKIEDAKDSSSWYGKYHSDQLVEVICSKCLPDNREKWRS